MVKFSLPMCWPSLAFRQLLPRFPLRRLSTVARLMAKRVTEAWTTVPHFYIVREVDAGGLKSARERLAAAIEQLHQVRLTITDLLVAIVARTLIGIQR